MGPPPPPTLVKLALGAVGRNLTIFSPHLLAASLPVTSLVDILHHVATGDCETSNEVVDAELCTYVVTLFPLLLVPLHKRDQLHRLIQEVSEKELSREEDEGRRRGSTGGVVGDGHLRLRLPRRLANAFTKSSSSNAKEGLRLGCFLLDAGWYSETAIVMRHVIEHMSTNLEQRLTALEKLLLAESYHNLVGDAGTTYSKLVALITELKDTESLTRIRVYNAFSIYHYSENRYDKALRWSISAMNGLKQTNCPFTESPSSPASVMTVIDVLRQAAICCSVKRELVKAKLLITKVLTLARSVFGTRSIRYADALMDYGFYLISSDNVRQGVDVYTEAVAIRQEAFGTYNINTALALTELAYSLYVQEYNTGKFGTARCYAEQAMTVASRLLPSKHLLQASSSRVLALILEEIAIDNAGSPSEEKLLVEAETLHMTCLQLTLSVFGEMNVQSAKHYGNLGRLYQTMKKYQEAEVMHLKAISIKERLLGEWDYEVALSVGHLASLYNYDLGLFHKAEHLHLRSIAIGERLFGEAYSGLEYDYRGLLQVYLMTGREGKYTEYSHILANWKLLQDIKSAAVDTKPSSGQLESCEPLESTLDQFHQLSWCRWKDDDPNAEEETTP